ncbi:FAD-dependent oxidoreductase [Georgenia halophila]|uniref:FAD-dependent oxidoreductase n=1 Tax=Georgenia halophila TaxID=620889 RepID=UPI003CD07010
MSSDAPVVVVGAGAAGVTVAEALRREGDRRPIMLIGNEPHMPYDRPPLSKAFPLGTVDEARMTLRESAGIASLGIDLRLGRSATRLETTTRRLHIDDGSLVTYRAHPGDRRAAEAARRRLRRSGRPPAPDAH